MARPDGWRLLFLPRLAGRLLESVGAGLLVPAVVTCPLVLFVVLPVAGVIGGFAALWRTALVSLVLLLTAGVVVAAMAARAATETVRWVDLRPAHPPATFTVRRGWRSADTPLSDLRRITVLRRYRLAAFLGVRVVLHAGTRTVTGDFAPGKGADAAALAAWLAGRLAPAGVEVASETVDEPALLPVEAWWPARKVAAMWNVPVEQVAGMAQEHDVRSRTLLPRAGALHRPGHPVPPHYNPDDVCRVARRSVPT